MDYKLRYSGKNFLSFLNFLERFDLSAYKIKYDKDVVTFEMSAKDYKILKNKNKVFKISVLKVGGIKRIFHLFFNRIGLVVGLLAVILLTIIFNKIAFDVKVVGNNNIGASEIKNAIINYGYQFGKSTHFDKDKMERYLLENVEGLSLVSVAKKGNSLVVSVVEKSEQLNESFPFYAPYNMVVKNINLISGTAVVKSGDVVKKGDVLVENYTINADGDKIEIEANALIDADIFFCDNIVVKKEEEIFEKTGNKLTFSTVSFFKAKTPFYGIKYAFYDINMSNTPLSNGMLLPLYYNKVEIVELKKVLKSFDYDKDSEKYFEQSKKNAYQLVPSGVIINDEICRVTECNDKYIFQTYLKSEMRFSNDN